MDNVRDLHCLSHCFFFFGSKASLFIYKRKSQQFQHRQTACTDKNIHKDQHNNYNNMGENHI